MINTQASLSYLKAFENATGYIFQFTRQDQLNCVNFETLEHFLNELKKIKTKPIKPIIIMSTNEKAFSSGLDMQQLAYFYEDKNMEKIKKHLQNLFEIMGILIQYPGETVSLWNGFTLGGGLSFSGVAKHKICFPSTKILCPYSKIGLATFTNVFEKMDLNDVLQLHFTNKTLTGEECFHIGLATGYFANKYDPATILNELNDLSRFLKITEKESIKPKDNKNNQDTNLASQISYEDLFQKLSFPTELKESHSQVSLRVIFSQLHSISKLSPLKRLERDYFVFMRLLELGNWYPAFCSIIQPKSNKYCWTDENLIEQVSKIVSHEIDPTEKINKLNIDHFEKPCLQLIKATKKI